MSYADNPRASGNPPKGSDIPPEPVGPVTSDSLAAESLNQGGDFAGGDAVPLAVKGNQSTLNNTDSSSAVPLHAASSGAARERQDERGADSDERGAAGMKYPDALGGQGNFSGAHNLDGYTGGPSADRATDGYRTQQPAGDSDFDSKNLSSGGPEKDDQTKSSSGTSNGLPGSVQGSTATPADESFDGPSAGADSRPHVDSAPNYAARTSGAIATEGEGKPKGNNLTEGDIPQTKTFIGDVGGRHDPGRLAEQGFAKTNAETAGNGKRDYTEGGENPFEALNSSERA